MGKARGPGLFVGSYVLQALLVRWTFDLLFEAQGVPLWPPLGISIALILLTPKHLRWWVILGSSLGEKFGFDTSGFDESAGEFLGGFLKDLGERIFVPPLMERLLGPIGFRNTRRTLVFLLLCAATGLLFALVPLLLDPPDSDRLEFYTDFAVGDALAIAAFAPLALVGRAQWLQDASQRIIRIELLWTLLLLVAVFMVDFVTDLPVAYLSISVAVWIAIRFGPRAAIPASALLVFGVGFGTVQAERGVWGLTQFADLRSAQFFTAAVVMSVLTTGSYAQRSEEARRRTQAAITALPDLIAVTDDHSVLESWPGQVDGLDPASLLIDAGGGPRILQDQRPGGNRYFEIRSAPLDQDRTLSIARDVTDLRVGEIRLAQSEQRWKDLAATAFEGLVIVDFDERINFASKTFAESFGTSPEWLAGRPISKVFPPDDWRRWEPRLRRAVASDERIETWFTDGNGQRRWILVSSRPWFDAEGDRVGAAFFIAETTESHRTERARRTLESRLAMVEESERREITQRIHDGPLQELVAVDIKLQLALETGELPEHLAGTSQILEEVISQLRSTLNEFAPPSVASGELLEELVRLGERIADDEELQIRRQRLHGAEADGVVAIRLYQIGREAVINAIRHASPTEISLTLSRHEAGFLLEVVDNGEGIDAEFTVGRDGHFGVRGMIERAERANGWCSVGPGNTTNDWGSFGTAVRIWLPTEQQPALTPQ